MTISVYTRRLLGVFMLTWMLAVPARAQVAPGQAVYEKRSLYQTITVWDTTNGFRQMIFDRKGDGTDPIQSEMDKTRPTDLTLAYSKHMIAALPLAAKTKSVFIVGLGGACIERYLFARIPEATIETAELDPEVVNVARLYFNFHDDGVRQKVSIGDGRKILERSKDKFDVLMLDAFSATSIPYALSTKEFLQVCKDHLAEGGLVAANLWYEAPEYHDMLKTYDAVFPEWHVMRCPGSTNAILVALPEKKGINGEKWMEAAKAFEKKYPTGLNLPSLIDNSLEDATRIPTDAKVILDRNEPKGN